LKIKNGDIVSIDFKTEKTDLNAENISLDIIFENEDFVIVNKDA
jgi:23S rRNA-/tRNA-specific pseudouridylate synthase